MCYVIWQWWQCPPTNEQHHHPCLLTTQWTTLDNNGPWWQQPQNKWLPWPTMSTMAHNNCHCPWPLTNNTHEWPTSATTTNNTMRDTNYKQWWWQMMTICCHHHHQNSTYSVLSLHTQLTSDQYQTNDKWPAMTTDWEQPTWTWPWDDRQQWQAVTITIVIVTCHHCRLSLLLII